MNDAEMQMPHLAFFTSIQKDLPNVKIESRIKYNFLPEFNHKNSKYDNLKSKIEFLTRHDNFIFSNFRKFLEKEENDLKNEICDDIKHAFINAERDFTVYRDNVKIFEFKISSYCFTRKGMMFSYNAGGNIKYFYLSFDEENYKRSYEQIKNIINFHNGNYFNKNIGTPLRLYNLH